MQRSAGDWRVCHFGQPLIPHCSDRPRVQGICGPVHSLSRKKALAVAEPHKFRIDYWVDKSMSFGQEINNGSVIQEQLPYSMHTDQQENET